MLVEFIGAAGVGKTYLSERVVDALKERGMAARSFRQIPINKAHPRNLALAAKAVYLGLMTSPKGPSEFARAVGALTRYSIRRSICEEIGGICIASEGLFHRLITLHRNSRSSGMTQLADILFRSVRPPDVIVVVEASAETIFERRKARNRSNDVFSFDSTRIDIADLELGVQAIQHVRTCIHPGLKILRISADLDVSEENVRLIVRSLTGLLLTR